MPAIEVSHLTKEYRLGAMQSLRDSALNAGRRLLGRPVVERPLFKALDDVSFAIEPGEVVGIIGHNGAGKSTLLKMLARISTPTRGSVKVHGRIAPLIEVGAGFVPDFTGRENVYLNAAILGMSKAEIERKFDEIVDFAEMAEFIDTPVKRYSSGMQVKLAFAVATSIDSEILIVDEVLAVGDLAFQRKCFDRMEDLIKRQGRTVLLVSHNIRQVSRMCSRVMLFDHGRCIADGAANEICEAFYARSNDRILDQRRTAATTATRLLQSGELELLDICLLNASGSRTDTIEAGMPCTIRCVFEAHTDLADIEAVYGFHTADFVYLSSMETSAQLPGLRLAAGVHVLDCLIRAVPMTPGAYAIRVGVYDQLLTKIFYGETLKLFAVADGSRRNMKPPILPGLVEIAAQWKVTRARPGDATAQPAEEADAAGAR